MIVKNVTMTWADRYQWQMRGCASNANAYHDQGRIDLWLFEKRMYAAQERRLALEMNATHKLRERT